MNSSESNSVVTFLVPVHNRPRLLRQALDSLLAQTDPRWTALIIDDASTDETPEVARSYTERDVRFRVLRLEEKAPNIAAVQNAARGHVTTPFIAIQDSDDLSLPQRLERQLAFLEARPDVAACGTWTIDITIDGTPRGGLEPPVDPEEIGYLARCEDPVANPTAFLRRQALEEIGWFDDSYALSFDAKLWSDLLRYGFSIANIPERLVKRRVHPAMNSILNDIKPFWARKAYASLFSEPLTGFAARRREELLAFFRERFSPRCAVFGTGRAARYFFSLMKSLGVEITSFVERVPRNRSFLETPVLSLEEFLSGPPLPLAVAAKPVWYEICSSVPKEFRPFPIHRLLIHVRRFEKELGLRDSDDDLFRKWEALRELWNSFGNAPPMLQEADIFGAGPTGEFVLELCRRNGVTVHFFYDSCRAGQEFYGIPIRHPQEMEKDCDSNRPVILASSRCPDERVELENIVQSAGRVPVPYQEFFQIIRPLVPAALRLLSPREAAWIGRHRPGIVWDEYGTYWYDHARFPPEGPERAEFLRRVKEFEKLIAKTIAREKPTSVLEVGCGMGRHLRNLRKHGVPLTFGCDISHRMLNRSGERLVAEAAAARLPFRTDAADVVFTAGGVLQYLPPDQRTGALRELMRVARRAVFLWETSPREESPLVTAAHPADWEEECRKVTPAVQRLTVPEDLNPSPTAPERHFFLRMRATSKRKESKGESDQLTFSPSKE
ncbi:MAG: glycosyltransferase [Candidatus Hydrogenedentota bacterium]|nr:MAG: glycosyltransferase [Candidatus Hydrogenedentota bacterium]